MIIFDAHADTPTRLLDENKSLFRNDFHIDYERLKKNESIQVFATFISPEYKDKAMERLDTVVSNFLREAYESGLKICKTQEEMKKTKYPYGILSLEGGEPIENLNDIDYLKNLGILMIAPTWNYNNKLACGILDNEDTGLTEFGKKAVKRMNDQGILIDVSHLSEKSFWDVCKISRKPICASHSNSKSVKDNPRNLTDNQFIKIRDMNGCVGINFYPPFLGDSIECAVDHINYFLSLGGENNIGLGSDFDGVDSLPYGVAGCQDMAKVIKMLPYSLDLREKIANKNFMRVILSQNC